VLVRECRRDRPLFVFGMERDRVLSHHKSENWFAAGCVFMASRFVDWRGSRVADWPNPKNINSFGG